MTPVQNDIAHVLVVDRRNDGVHFRPGSYANRSVVRFLALAALILVLGWLLPEDNRYLDLSPYFFAAIFVGLAIWHWWFRNTTLIVTPDGRVTYGSRELCPAGSVRCVKIEEQPSSDGSCYHLSLQLLDGSVVALSAPYFSGRCFRDDAFQVAQAVAHELRVNVESQLTTRRIGPT